jgi:hypothetical protein
MKHNRALDAAIALSQAPTRSTVMRAQELPTGVNLLLRILVGDADALSEARNLTGLREGLAGDRRIVRTEGNAV